MTTKLFAIIGRNRDIAIEELKIIQARSLENHNNNVITFSSPYKEKIKQLG